MFFQNRKEGSMMGYNWKTILRINSFYYVPWTKLLQVIQIQKYYIVPHNYFNIWKQMIWVSIHQLSVVQVHTSI